MALRPSLLSPSLTFPSVKRLCFRSFHTVTAVAMASPVKSRPFAVLRQPGVDTKAGSTAPPQRFHARFSR